MKNADKRVYADKLQTKNPPNLDISKLGGFTILFFQKDVYAPGTDFPELTFPETLGIIELSNFHEFLRTLVINFSRRHLADKTCPDG